MERHCGPRHMQVRQGHQINKRPNAASVNKQLHVALVQQNLAERRKARSKSFDCKSNSLIEMAYRLDKLQEAVALSAVVALQ